MRLELRGKIAIIGIAKRLEELLSVIQYRFIWIKNPKP
jgi:hypothetical protein